jgi:hypothetical protein
MSEVIDWHRRLPAALALLLMAGAALVLLGATVEHRGASETGRAVESSAGTSHTEQAGEAGGGEGGESAKANGHQIGEVAGEQSENETVLGVRVESPVALTALVSASAGLAVLVWRRPTRLVAAAVVAFALAAGAFDVAEIDRQLSAERTVLALLAVTVLLLRAATVTAAALLWRNTPRGISRNRAR